MGLRGRLIGEGLALTALVGTLAACAMTAANQPLPKPPNATGSCAHYTPAQLHAIGASLAKLQPGDPLIGATADYVSLMRRVCLGG